MTQKARIIPKTKTTVYKQGLYIPKYPHKYVGDVTKIRYMSSWELQTHAFFDNNPNVLRWSSETLAIPYWNPVKDRAAKYYPDYWIEYINSDREVVQEIVEVKPKSQTTPPRANKKNKLYEQLVFETNKAKWMAATEFCKHHNLQFRIITEQSIFK